MKRQALPDDHKKPIAPSEKNRAVIYGVTDRSQDPWWVKLNDAVIDHSPVRDKEKGIVFDSLRLLVNSGVRFVRAVEMLASRQRNLRFKRVLHSIVYDMQHNGTSFSAAMAKYPRVFHRSEVKMIYSGELAGKINETLESVAAQIQKNIALRLRIKSALMYPMTVIGAILLASIVVVTFIVPKFIVLFEEFGSHELPWTTNILMTTSDFFRHYWWFALTVLAAGAMVFQNWKRTPSGRRHWDELMLRLPLLKTLINNIQTVHIASNFSTLMSSGIPVTKALHILADIIPNRAIGEALFAVEEKTIQGQPLSVSFKEDPIFDPILGEVIEIGEQGGRIPEILEKTAAQYELEVDAQLKNLTTLIEPLIILCVGGAIVFMAMAIMTPIFQLQDLFTAA